MKTFLLFKLSDPKIFTDKWASSNTGTIWNLTFISCFGCDHLSVMLQIFILDVAVEWKEQQIICLEWK